jgi:hypothetical protein
MNKDYKSVIKEIDKALLINGEKKTYREYKSAIAEVDIMLQKLEEKKKIDYDNEKTCI